MSSAGRCIPTPRISSPACRASATLTPKAALSGAPPNLAEPPPGCRFHPRCPLAMDICRRENPELTMLAPGHRVACFAADPAVRPQREAIAAAPETAAAGAALQ